ncbi:hypothetical protein BK826_09700 [Rothia kristinae]|uniref:Carotene biosynthesis associated membrane protein n=1 Tax=Rothia kristinae TaxID=37923 RepID=A0A1S2MXR8_9MICC|nr:DUF2029 domain-containing protein [Rothia kristinae]OIJ34958.1 hypothetical protein BK826_09700 [Rothia kristinae]
MSTPSSVATSARPLAPRFDPAGPGMRTVVLALGTLCSLLSTVWSWYHSRLLPEGTPWAGLLRGMHRKGAVEDPVMLWLLPLGLVFLLCWWHVLRHAGRYRLWMVLALWALPQFLAVGGDMFNYAEQGWALLHGADPSLVPAGTVPGPFQDWAGRWTDTTVGYPVLALALSALAVTLGGANAVGTLFFLHLWSAVGLALLAWSLPRLAASLGADPRRVFALVMLNPMILQFQLGQGHHDTLAAGLGALGLWCLIRWRRGWTGWVLAGLLFAAAAGIKQPALLFPLVAAGMLQLRAQAGSRFALPAGSRPPYREGLLSLGRTAVRVAPLWVGQLLVLFVLPPLAGVGVGWRSATGAPGPGSLTIPRILQVAGDVQRVRRGESIMDPGGLLLGFLLGGAAVWLLLVILTRRFGWNTLLWTGLAALFLCGGAYFPWYGIWLVVPLVLSRPRWPLPAIVLTAMTASSTFPIFHGTGVLGAYALAWTAALLGALAAGWLLRPRPAGTADQTSPIHFQ